MCQKESLQKFKSQHTKNIFLKVSGINLFEKQKGISVIFQKKNKNGH